MSDVQVETKQEETQSTEVGSEKKEPAFVVLRKEIQEALSNEASSWVRERVKSKLVEEKVAEYTQVTLDGLKARDEAEKALKSLKPDIKVYDTDGKLVSENFSEKVTQDRNKARETLSKIDSALEEALSKGKFDKLAQLTKKKDSTEVAKKE